MSVLDRGKSSDERAHTEVASTVLPLHETLPEQGRDYESDHYSRKEELIGKLLERYLTQPEERGNINSMLSAPNSPLGAESSAVLERIQALSLRITYLEVPEPEQKILGRVVDDLISIARKECTPEERQVLSEHTGHMTRWLGNESAKDAAERVHKIVSDVGKNDLASHVIEVGYRLNDTKAALIHGAEQVKDVVSAPLDRTIQSASEAIGEAKRSITKGFGELLHDVASTIRSGWSKVVELCAKVFEGTKSLLTSLWNNTIGAAHDFVTSLIERWDNAASIATDAVHSKEKPLDDRRASTDVIEVFETINGAIEEVQEWVEESRPARQESHGEEPRVEAAIQRQVALAPETMMELARIPDPEDPEFAHRMLLYRIGLNEPLVKSLPTPQAGESFTVLPSDPLSILTLKEACHHYIRGMQARLEGLTAIGEQLEAGDHPLQRKVDEFRRLAEQQEAGPGRADLVKKIASLELGIESLAKANEETKGWLEGQFAAYTDPHQFHALGQRELERNLKEQESTLIREVEQARMIRERNLPYTETSQIDEGLPFLNKQFFALYLATRHSANGINGSVTQQAVPYDEYKDVFAPSHREGYRMRQEVTLNGSATVGTVDFIRQIHRVPGLAAPEVQLTSYSQEMILRHLSATTPKVVFREGATYDVLPASPTRHVQLDVAEVQSAFPNGLPNGDLDEKQRYLLTTLGAAEVYAVLNPDVSLMGTASPEMQQYQQYIQQHRPDLSEACVVPLREQEAIAKVKEYLSSHPGEKVAMVYGAAHFFNEMSLDVKNTAIADMPLIISTDWPALHFDMMGEYMDAKALAIESSKSQELKALLALNSEEVSIVTFLSVKDPDLQLRLLPKVIPNYTYQTRPSDLERLLLSALPDKEPYDVVRREIRARASGEDPKAPFNHLAAKEYNWDEVAEAEPFRVDKTVLDEDHDPTRYELVRRASSIGYASYAVLASAEVQKEVLSKVVIAGTEEEIFGSLAAMARSPEVLIELQRHREDSTGPFFKLRFADASSLSTIALAQAPKSEYWKQLDWDARAEVVHAVGSVAADETETFFNERIVKALSNDAKAHRQIFCALETALRSGLHFEERLIEASPYLSLSHNPSTGSGFASLLEKAAEQQQWKAYQSLAILLGQEGGKDAWFSIIGTVPHLRNRERSLVLSLLVDELKKPESETRSALEPMLDMEIGPGYESEMTLLREAFDKAR